MKRYITLESIGVCWGYIDVTAITCNWQEAVEYRIKSYVHTPIERF